jgi:nucleotide-binding universal stress UspA family protein
MGVFKTILSAVDFSDMSHDVLNYAARLAAGSPGAHLVVTNVAPDPLQEPWMAEAIDLDFAQLRKAWIADAQYCLEILTRAEGLKPGTFTPVVVVGRPADAIVELARERSADLIVIGTHGYGPVQLGSVADRVLRLAHCPVLTVSHKALAALATQAARAAVAATIAIA